MQEHRYSFDVDATPEEIWGVMHQRPTNRSSGPVEIGEFGPIRRKIEHGPVTIEILHDHDTWLGNLRDIVPPIRP